MIGGVRVNFLLSIWSVYKLTILQGWSYTRVCSPHQWCVWRKGGMKLGKRWEDGCGRTGVKTNVRRVYDDNTEKQLYSPSPPQHHHTWCWTPAENLGTTNVMYALFLSLLVVLLPPLPAFPSPSLLSSLPSLPSLCASSSPPTIQLPVGLEPHRWRDCHLIKKYEI